MSKLTWDFLQDIELMEEMNDRPIFLIQTFIERAYLQGFNGNVHMFGVFLKAKPFIRLKVFVACHFHGTYWKIV